MLFSIVPDNAPKMPDVRLEGRRLVVRPPQQKDAAAWIDVRGRNQAFLAPWEPAWPDDALTPDFFRRRLARQAEEWRKGRGHGFLIFAGDDLVGGININNVVRGAAQFGSLGYWLAQDAQGKGYMREALSLVIAYGFSDLRLHRFNAACLAANERSRKLLLGLGFREEGFAAQYLKIADKWEDHVLFGLNNSV